MDGILEKLDKNIEDFPEAEGLDQAQMDELLEKLIEANDPQRDGRTSRPLTPGLA